MLRRKSSTVKIFCFDTHLKVFIFYKYGTIKSLLYKYIGEKLNHKKHFKVTKLIINCYRYSHIGNKGNNTAANANRDK